MINYLVAELGKIISIIIIVGLIVFILVKDHICFMDAENDDDEDSEKDCYHTGEW